MLCKYLDEISAVPVYPRETAAVAPQFNGCQRFKSSTSSLTKHCNRPRKLRRLRGRGWPGALRRPGQCRSHLVPSCEAGCARRVKGSNSQASTQKCPWKALGSSTPVLNRIGENFKSLEHCTCRLHQATIKGYWSVSGRGEGCPAFGAQDRWLRGSDNPKTDLCRCCSPSRMSNKKCQI